MGHVIMVVRVQQLRNDPALHSRIVGTLQQMVCQQHFVHRGWSFNEIERRTGIRDSLVTTGQHEMTGMAHFVRQRECSAHVVRPGDQNVGMRAVNGKAERPRRFARIVRIIHPTLAECPRYDLAVFGTKHSQRFLNQFASFPITNGRAEFRIKRCLQVAEHQFVQAELPLFERG
ncbi:hypothetical protein D1872_266720 [compost metagenome]